MRLKRNGIFLFALLVWGICRVSLGGSELTVFSPWFEQLDQAAMLREREALAALPSPSPLERFRRTLIAFFLAEYEERLAHPHLENQYLYEAEDACEFFDLDGFAALSESDRGRAAYLCVLVRAELLGNRPSGWQWGRLSRLQRELSQGQLSPMSQPERWYFEGRVYLELPPGQGQSFRRSLIALNFLSRARPDLSSIKYWLARAYQWHGNRSRAETLFQEALALHDVRTTLALAHTPPFLPADFDGLRYGLAPSLFYIPNLGFGGRLAFSDDRLGDSARSATASLSLGTRDYWEGDLVYTDPRLLEPVEIGARLEVKRQTEDFYGLGIGATDSQHTLFNTERAVVEAQIRERLSESIHFSLGWRFKVHSIKSVEGAPVDLASLPAGRGFTFSGPWAELALDSRDSQVDPHQGGYLGIQGFFPTHDLGSRLSFQEWRGEAHYYWEFSFDQGIALGLGVVGLSSDAPFGEYPAMGEAFPLPGVRVGRFQDRSLGVGAIEYRGRVWGPLSVLVFAESGTVASDLGTLIHSPVRLGAGGGLQYQFTRYRSPLLRLEVGRFADETVCQATAQALW